MYNLEVIKEDCRILDERLDTAKLANKNVLITGANGLIGSFLADYLCYLNDVFSYNMKIYLTSYSTKDKVTRLTHLLDRKDVQYFAWDASERIDTEIFCDDIDHVFFCSGYGQPAKFTKDVVKTSFINTVGVDSLLRYLERLNKLTNFLFISSSEVYGDPDISKIPTKEDDEIVCNPNNNRSSYILSKTLGEVICRSYSDKIRVKIARVGLIYGPGVLIGDNRVLQELIFKAVSDRKITLLDEGSALRNYLYLVDGIEMILNLAINSESEQIVYNIGGSFESVTIFELAQKIGNILKCDVYKGVKQNDFATMAAPKNVYMSMERYAKEFVLRKNRFIPLDKGIKNVIRWYEFEYPQ